MITAEGERVASDAVVLTTELPLTYELLGRQPRRLLPLRAAPSAVVLHVGCRAAAPAEPQSAHHTILFGEAWRKPSPTSSATAS